MRVSLVPILLLALTTTSRPAMGWGREGHRLSAALAETQLTNQAKAALAELLDPGESLMAISTWADEVRKGRPESSTWHYINIPIDENRPWRSYCPPEGCVVSAILEMESRLADKALSREQRREALFFLVHFIQDVHQPLHSGDMRDRGGNDVTTVYNNYAGNLHGTWDTGLILGYQAADAGFDESVKRAPMFFELELAAQGDAGNWAAESHAIARDVAYQGLGTERPALLGADYAQRARPYVVRQLRLSGLRLAAVLNRTFGRGSRGGVR